MKRFRYLFFLTAKKKIIKKLVFFRNWSKGLVMVMMMMMDYRLKFDGLSRIYKRKNLKQLNVKSEREIENMLTTNKTIKFIKKEKSNKRMVGWMVRNVKTFGKIFFLYL